MNVWLEQRLRGAILSAADNALVARNVRRYGMRLGAQRFVAGETATEFLRVTRRLNDEGFAVACGILGEGVLREEQAREATAAYCELLQTFSRDRYDANVAFKLTHVGLDIDPELAYENAATIARTAAQTGNTMRLDMEQATYVDRTLAVYARLHEQHPNVGCVLQSYLFRSPNDLRSILPRAPNVRFVKGAYKESADIAYERKADVDRAYLDLVTSALRGEGYTAIATHDPAIIEQVATLAETLALPRRGRYEFQMLYGISSTLAQRLVANGYRVRIAVPFGDYWFPYLMRRLAERPANLAFFLRGALSRA